MTVVCGPGNSHRITGAPASVFFSVAGLIGFFGDIPYLWLAAIAAYLGSLAYDVDQICSTDPPDEPTIVTSDWFFLIGQGGDRTQHLASVAKFDQLIRHWLWYQNCECIAGTTADPAAPQSQPTDWPTPDPNGRGLAAAPCLTFGPESRGVASSGGFAVGAAAFAPLTVTAITADVENAITSGAGATAQIRFEYQLQASGGTTVGPRYDFALTPTSAKHTVTIPYIPGYTHLELYINGTAGTGFSLATVTFYFWCNGDDPSGGGQLECCSDPHLSVQVQEILDLVTLLQRYVAPFALIDGEHHVVFDQGEFDVGRVVGIRVESGSSLPSSIGVLDGHPDELFDFGKISWGDADGFAHSERITTLPFESTPFQASRFTRVGFSLAPGVTVDMVELQAEA